MSDVCRLIWYALIGVFRSRAALEAEILVLRHQLNVLRRKSARRLAFSNVDRLVFVGLYRVAPGLLDALKILTCPYRKPKTAVRDRESADNRFSMSDLCRLIWCALIGLFRSRAALEAEILVLRHQLNVLRRKSPKRLALGNIDRLVFVGLYRVAPGVLDALKILGPQTVIRWHRAGFRAYWRWRSQPRGGRPKTAADIRQLIRDMSIANPVCTENQILQYW
jgi:hypothetical protein